MTISLEHTLLEEAKASLTSAKRLVDNAIEQIPEEQLHISLDGETNCIAVIMKHLASTLKSRWTDFLTTDGEKPWRNREDEFVDTLSGQSLLDSWDDGWKCLFDTLDSLTPDDLRKTVTIRGESQTVTQAISRTLIHACIHAGQILLLARHVAGPKWKMIWNKSK
ncbi:MAG: DUF1572 family protein [Planctomycetaceae bacterium]|nr:DUF1572 family protein [Planctomycetales bacterium]MCB9924355.1 DUF1572 family protein [Planctomycetaceae bacterium]